MVDEINKMTFETALAKLEQAAEALKKDDTALEDAIQYCEEGLKYYNYCTELLTEAKQKIMIFDRNTRNLKEME